MGGGWGQVWQAAPLAAAPLVQRQTQVGEFAALEGVQAGAVVQGRNSILQKKRKIEKSLKT